VVNYCVGQLNTLQSPLSPGPLPTQRSWQHRRKPLQGPNRSRETPRGLRLGKVVIHLDGSIDHPSSTIG
jgi:hypothetical protein